MPNRARSVIASDALQRSDDQSFGRDRQRSGANDAAAECDRIWNAKAQESNPQNPGHHHPLALRKIQYAGGDDDDVIAERQQCIDTADLKPR